MRIPKKEEYPLELHIGEETYKLKFAKRILGEPRSTVGLCDISEDSKTIWIRSDLTKQNMLRCFIHEVLHALECEYEIKLRHKTVYQLEKAIADILLFNF